MDNCRGKGNSQERECSKTANHRLKGAQKTNSDSEDKMSKHRSEDIDEIDDALSDDELEETVGGRTTVVVPLCKNCQQRIAVHQMTLCATCFLKLK